MIRSFITSFLLASASISCLQAAQPSLLLHHASAHAPTAETIKAFVHLPWIALRQGDALAEEEYQRVAESLRVLPEADYRSILNYSQRLVGDSELLNIRLADEKTPHNPNNIVSNIPLTSIYKVRLEDSLSIILDPRARLSALHFFQKVPLEQRESVLSGILQNFLSHKKDGSSMLVPREFPEHDRVSGYPRVVYEGKHFFMDRSSALLSLVSGLTRFVQEANYGRLMIWLVTNGIDLSWIDLQRGLPKEFIARNSLLSFAFDNQVTLQEFRNMVGVPPQDRLETLRAMRVVAAEEARRRREREALEAERRRQEAEIRKQEAEEAARRQQEIEVQEVERRQEWQAVYRDYCRRDEEQEIAQEIFSQTERRLRGVEEQARRVEEEIRDGEIRNQNRLILEQKREIQEGEKKLNFLEKEIKNQEDRIRLLGSASVRERTTARDQLNLILKKKGDLEAEQAKKRKEIRKKNQMIATLRHSNVGVKDSIDEAELLRQEIEARIRVEVIARTQPTLEEARRRTQVARQDLDNKIQLANEARQQADAEWRRRRPHDLNIPPQYFTQARQQQRWARQQQEWARQQQEQARQQQQQVVQQNVRQVLSNQSVHEEGIESTASRVLTDLQRRFQNPPSRNEFFSQYEAALNGLNSALSEDEKAVIRSYFNHIFNEDANSAYALRLVWASLHAIQESRDKKEAQTSFFKNACDTALTYLLDGVVGSNSRRQEIVGRAAQLIGSGRTSEALGSRTCGGGLRSRILLEWNPSLVNPEAFQNPQAKRSALMLFIYKKAEEVARDAVLSELQENYRVSKKELVHGLRGKLVGLFQENPEIKDQSEELSPYLDDIQQALQINLDSQAEHWHDVVSACNTHVEDWLAKDYPFVFGAEEENALIDFLLNIMRKVHGFPESLSKDQQKIVEKDFCLYSEFFLGGESDGFCEELMKLKPSQKRILLSVVTDKPSKEGDIRDLPQDWIQRLNSGEKEEIYEDLRYFEHLLRDFYEDFPFARRPDFFSSQCKLNVSKSELLKRYAKFRPIETLLDFLRFSQRRKYNLIEYDQYILEPLFQKIKAENKEIKGMVVFY